MISLFFHHFIHIFIDMSFYIMLGLFFVGLLHTYVKKELILRQLGDNSLSSVIKAAAVGVPLPLCSCGVVPTAIELKKSGASRGAVTSFLISTPQTGIDSILVTFALMGLPMAIFRPVAAFAAGIFGGVVVNLFGKQTETNAEPIAAASCCSGQAEPAAASCCCGEAEPKKVTPAAKFKSVFTYAFGSFWDGISLHFFIGIIIAALISAFIPADFFISLGLDSGLLVMLLVIAIGLPMYVCSTSSIPIALSLIAKGLSPGAAFVFLFAGPVSNIASILVLSKALGKKNIVLYIFSVVVAAVGFGLLFDLLYQRFNFTLQGNLSLGSAGAAGEYFNYAAALVFFVITVKGIYKTLKHKLGFR